MKQGICKYCGETFTKKHNKEAYCSDDCRNNARKIQNRNKANRYYYKIKYDITENTKCISCGEDDYLIVDYNGDQFVNYGHHHKNNAKCIRDKISNNESVEEFKLNKPAPSLPGHGKYYCETQYGFQVIKRIKGKLIYFGLYETEEEAQKIVELLKQNNWNPECLNHA